jgi:hypothetical protein
VGSRARPRAGGWTRTPAARRTGSGGSRTCPSHRGHWHEEFLKVLGHVDAALEQQEVGRRFSAHPEYHCHFTQTSASWLNQLERFFAAIRAERIRRRSFGSVEELERAIEEYLRAHNGNPKPFVWTISTGCRPGLTAFAPSEDPAAAILSIWSPRVSVTALLV